MQKPSEVKLEATSVDLSSYMKLDVDEVCLGDRGCTFLFKASWKKVVNYQLGILYIKKATISSQKRDASIFLSF